VRRNIKQLDDLIMVVKSRGEEIGKEVERQLDIVRRVYEQQREIYREKKRRIDDRIISLHKPEVRPTIRGIRSEGGTQPCGWIRLLDHMSHDNFNEASRFPIRLNYFKRNLERSRDGVWATGSTAIGTIEST